MKAVVFYDVGDIRLDEVKEPRIEQDTDAIVRITTSAICGTDLHMIRGTMPGMKSGTILGHEGVGIIIECGKKVRNFRPGDRVVIPSTIACGSCSYCLSGHYAQCDRANPNGPHAGTAFYGGPKDSGPFQGLQAERARIPFAHVNLVKLPDEISNENAILLSDIFPTGYFGAELAQIKAGDTVAVFGCGPVGQFAIASAKLMNAGRIFAIDGLESRLEMAREQGAETINFEKEDPVKMIRELTDDIGVIRAIDAVGVDANHPHHYGGLADMLNMKKREQEKNFQEELEEIAPQTNQQGNNWRPGDAPSQVLSWAVEALAKSGTLSIIGVYPQDDRFFPIGAAMNKNLTIQMGNCHHRKYIPTLINLILAGAVNPQKILTHMESFTSVIDAYKAFDERKPGWVKVALNTAA